MSIKLKLTLTTVLLVLVASVTVLFITNRTFEYYLNAICEEEVVDAKRSFHILKEDDTAMLQATIEALLLHEPFKEAFVSRDREGLYKLAEPIFSRLKVRYGITHFYFIDPLPGKRCFLRVHNKDFNGDEITRKTYEKSLSSGTFGAGIELGKTAFALRVVHPFSHGGHLAGYLELGQEIDHFFKKMHEQSGNEFGLLVKKDKLDRQKWASVREKKGMDDNWDDIPDVVLIDSTLADESLIKYEGDIAGIPEDGLVLETFSKDKTTYTRGLFPLHDAGGEVVGSVFVLRDITDVASIYFRLRKGLTNLSLFILLLLTGVALILITQLNNLIFKRLKEATDVIVRLVGGDYDSEIRVKSKDEIGAVEQLLEQFRRIVAGLIKKT